MQSKIWEKIKYLLFRSKVQLTVAFILAIILVLFLLWYSTRWWNWAEPFITLLTLGVALAVWYKQTIEAWENDLPKRLTVQYLYHDREVMRCELAELSSEADIRNLGQQIGLQISGKQHLKFVAANIKQIKAGIKLLDSPGTGDYGTYIKEYKVIFILTELPDSLQADHSAIWRFPFIKPNGDNDVKFEPNCVGERVSG